MFKRCGAIPYSCIFGTDIRKVGSRPTPDFYRHAIRPTFGSLKFAEIVSESGHGAAQVLLLRPAERSSRLAIGVLQSIAERKNLWFDFN